MHRYRKRSRHHEHPIPFFGFFFLGHGYPGIERRVTQIPRNAVETGLYRALNKPHDVAIAVPDRKNNGRCVFTLFVDNLVQTSERDVLILIFEFLLSLAPRLLAGLQRLWQVVGEVRTKLRVRRDVVAVALTARAQRFAAAEFMLRHIPVCLAHREQCDVVLQHLLGHVAQWRVVIEDVEAAAKRRAHQVVLPRLDHEITERNVRAAALELGPVIAAVHREKHAKLGAEKQEPRLHVILHHAPEHMTLGEVVRDALPRTAAVFALQDIR